MALALWAQALAAFPLTGIEVVRAGDSGDWFCGLRYGPEDRSMTCDECHRAFF
jgi:hypothetical protein